ncbi:MAG: chemotaxis protein chel [Geminicoccaceae bacterium]|nr:chemotaxis protein chel [Geminicoccaceae bacterium]
MDARVTPAAAPAAPAGRADPAGRPHEAAVEFEAVFLSQMLRGMSGGLGADGPFGKEPFGSLLIDEYARLIARSGGVGIASAVQRELLRLQEVQP